MDKPPICSCCNAPMRPAPWGGWFCNCRKPWTRTVNGPSVLGRQLQAVIIAASQPTKKVG